METLINFLKVFGIVALVLEGLLVVGMVALGVDYVLDNRRESKTRVARHRAPVQETAIERAKRQLRELKEKEAKENRFFNEYFQLGFYKNHEQANRDDKVMAVFTAEEI